MNILFLDSIDRDTFGGYENWIRLAAGHFVRKGDNVTVAGRSNSEYLRRLRAESDRIKVLELPISGDFDPGTINRLRRYLTENQIDLMTVNFNKDIRIGGLASKWQGRTKVVWRIGLDITKNSLAHRFLTPRLVDAVFVPSEGLKKQVTRHGYLTDDMVKVIYTGLEEKEFKHPDLKARAILLEKYDLPDYAIIAVTSGRFVDQKGHTFLAEAAAKIVPAENRIRFLWLGDGPLRNTLQDKLNELNIGNHVIFAGMLDNTERELAGSDLMIHSAVDEPFSHAVLEGMRAGLPLVATNVGGTPEAVVDGETGLLVPPRDPEAMAQAVLGLVSDNEKMIAMGRAGQERWRKEFTITRMMDQVEALFAKVLRN